MPILPGIGAVLYSRIPTDMTQSLREQTLEVRKLSKDVWKSRKFRQMEMLKMCMVLMKQKENGRGCEDMKIKRSNSSLNPLATNVIYIYIYIYIYMEHPFLMFLDHTQRRSTFGRTPLDE